MLIHNFNNRRLWKTRSFYRIQRWSKNENAA